ncbi:uroporphyrinogen-III synthase [Shimia gijangensis]|uniref:Uroporphyrinogen-III synthase n=1 Tax=Shimia gijangensis TaxID=1470563 RepID=A0A1M6MV73_9RHOB|nr:uroporphyrinogen-III synthase [Shimia gijangensis]SHJ87408.1 uroporphyrinogen-III synthase [Shimia gijangensis]
MLAVIMKPQDPIILLTRPLEAAEKFTHQLKAAGVQAEILVSPVQGIEPVKFEEPINLAGAIFTSRNGVDAVMGRDAPCWCVGEATAKAARAKGWQAVSADGDAEAVFRRIAADHPKGPLIHFRGAYARGNLAERLWDDGIETREMVVYQQVSLPMSDAAKAVLMRENPVILPLFSPRSAAQLVQQGPFAAPLWVVAMSEAVAANAAALSPTKLEISVTPDAKGMVAAIKQVAKAAYGIESEGNST